MVGERSAGQLDCGPLRDDDLDVAQQRVGTKFNECRQAPRPSEVDDDVAQQRDCDECFFDIPGPSPSALV
jgi:hypothetical protein